MIQIKEELFSLLGVGVGEGSTKVAERKLCGPWPHFYTHGNGDQEEKKGIFPIVTQWFIRSPGGILIIIPPQSLGCRDLVNMISRHGMQRIFRSTGCREDVQAFLALDEHSI